MELKTSPQHIAVGEGNQRSSDKDSYVSKINGQKVSSVDLCPISMEQGIPTVEFSVDEVNSFTREEGLHQAVIFKFSYGKPEIQDLRRLLPKHFDVKGLCNTGQLEYRHILVRFDLFEDFANVVSISSGYIKSKGEDFFFRTFPWTMDFNPREETSKAVTWISFPELPANFFAKKSIMSIASAVGKPIAIDKATQDRTRPSTARVKILINLLDKHPKKVKLKIVDKKSGRIVEYDQRIVFDNLPKYCTYCHYQGHDVLSCRRKLDEESEASHLIEPEKQSMLGKLRGDARDYLNANNASRQMEEAIPRRESVPSLSVSDLQISKANLVNLDDNLTKELQGDARDLLNRRRNAQGKDVHNQVHRNNAIWKQKIISHDRSEPSQLVKTVSRHNNEHISDRGNMSAKNDVSTTACSKIRSATERGKKSMTPVSFKLISKSDFEGSLANSSFDIGSVSGTKYVHAQQNPSDLTGQDISCNANFNCEKIPAVCFSLCPPNLNVWNNAQLQGRNLVDQSRRDGCANDFIPEPSIDRALVNKSSLTVPLKILSSKEDSDVCTLPAARDPHQIINEVSFPTALCHHTALNDNVQFGTLQKNCMKSTGGMTEGFHQSPSLLKVNQSVSMQANCRGILIDQNSDVVGSQLCDTEFTTNSNSQLNATPHQSQKSNIQQLENTEETTREDSMKLHITVQSTLSAAEYIITHLESVQTSNAALTEAENATQLLAHDQPSNPATEAACKEDSLLRNREFLVDKNISDKLQMLDDAVHLNAEFNTSSTTSRNVSTKNENKQNSNKSAVITSSSNSFVALASDKQEDKMMEKMEILKGNKIGGVIKKVNSFTPLSISSAYSGEDIIDNEDISSFEETNKHVIISSMKESVIKSKLWDQRPFDDIVNWDEGSSGGSSTEEENQLENYSSGDESDNTIKPYAHSSQAIRNGIANPAASASVLNHNAPIFIPNKAATAYPPMEPQTGITQKGKEQNLILASAENSGTGFVSKSLGMLIPSEQFPIQNEMEGRHLYEEGEEEDILAQCRINAARRGDLSPMHSNPNKKSHRRERSWDDRLVEHALVRKLPMRLAKQKQVTQPLVTKPRKSKNKAS